MQKVVNHLRGFVRVAVECPFPERFINLCAHNNIAFWGVERIDAVHLETTVAASDLSRTGELAVRLGGTLTQIGRHGLLFFLERFKKRIVLIAGLLVCLAALFTANRHIWEFTVEGNVTVSGEVILQALREVGVTVGTPSSGVDIESVRNRVLLKLEELSWITVNISGSRASVVVRERKAKPEILSRGTPVNIIADKAGIITRIDTLYGSAKVFPGDTVLEGQLLVSGLIDSAQVGVRLVNARAEVTARTWTELSALVPTGAVGKRYTGRSKTRMALIFGSARVNLYQNASQPYAMCDKISEETVLRVPPGVMLPVRLIKETFIEYEPVSYQMSEAVAEGVLRQTLGEALRGGIMRGEVVLEEVEFSSDTGFMLGRLTAECLERIDVPVRIDIAEAIGLP